MERRVLLALFLSFLVFYIYQTLMPAPVPPDANATTVPVTAGAAPGQTAAANAPPSAGGTLQGSGGAAPKAAPPPASETLVGDTQERELRIETDTVIAEFTNRGARLASWRLKKYLNQDTGEPLELVSTDLGDAQPLPFSLLVDDASATTTLNTALYTVTREEDRPGEPAVLRFEYANADGLHASKTFTIKPAGYEVALEASVEQKGARVAASVEWGPGPADHGAASRFHMRPEGIVFVGDDVSRYSASAVGKQPEYSGTYRFAGIDDHYFMIAALDPGPATISYTAVSVPPPPGSGQDARDLMAFTLKPGDPSAAMTFFVGPKEFDTLSALDPEFTKAIRYGIFTVIVVPLLRTLVWVNGFIGNFGWSIIVLTIIINGAMFPLRHKSVVSMRKMQEIQPEVKAIQERYSKLKSTDPAKQKMNQEMMDLYKARGVSPLSGCLPMILMMPVLYAFYNLLNYSIQLRGAPFALWIHDLSIPDPYYVTPILMGVSQLWQQRMMPTTGADPAQQKMMMFMPVMFTVLFLWAPSGLALYWLVSNVWMIGQTYLTNRMIGPPKVHQVRPAAERRLKRAGSGKSEAAQRES
jgi:YidC/Oxa1 family membrane protein insertase